MVSPGEILPAVLADVFVVGAVRLFGSTDSPKKPNPNS